MDLVFNIQSVLTTLHTTLDALHKPHRSVTLVAVSKTQSAEIIQAAFNAGICHFGENYWQELQKKCLALADLPINWHFIGRLQRNKAAHIAQHCAWVHSVDKMHLLPILNNHRPSHLPALNICLQVNLANETQKAGVLLKDLIPLVEHTLSFPNLRLRGLMLIPPACPDPTRYFLQLEQIFSQLKQQFAIPLDTLSMGMSADYVSAVLAGSTMVRVGRAIFGER
ncbi:MAG TPA: YggS family pyridoxal phosphate-dependent enzyme [Legionellales bacterium]|nr:YggS family pyridoxal phosphate-dependent enzyme [Legionellales bacterium]|tara:strand:+ start:1306 stop:1977 length:672 start_codon:yes stop_codon:yes gene_type:complete